MTAGGGCCLDGWLDVTPYACMYEIGFHPVTLKYRHRMRRAYPSPDPGVIIVRAIDAAWQDGKPPPYPS